MTSTHQLFIIQEILQLSLNFPSRFYQNIHLLSMPSFFFQQDLITVTCRTCRQRFPFEEGRRIATGWGHPAGHVVRTFRPICQSKSGCFDLVPPFCLCFSKWISEVATTLPWKLLHPAASFTQQVTKILQNKPKQIQSIRSSTTSFAPFIQVDTSDEANHPDRDAA